MTTNWNESSLCNFDKWLTMNIPKTGLGQLSINYNLNYLSLTFMITETDKNNIVITTIPCPLTVELSWVTNPRAGPLGHRVHIFDLVDTSRFLQMAASAYTPTSGVQMFQFPLTSK